jgi:Tfp pilus assembly protein PilO
MASLLDKKTFRFRIIRESLLIFVIILSTYFLGAQLRGRIEQINGTIIAENNLYGLTQFHKETFDLLNEHLRSIRELRDQIIRALPPTEDIREFLKILDTYALKHGVLTSVGVGAATVTNIKVNDVTLQAITINIDLTGELTAVRAYITEIEHLPYFFTITNINEKRDPTKPAFRHTIITGTLWTKPEQTLTQRQQ